MSASTGASGGVSSKSELLDVLSDVKVKVQDRLGIVDFPIPQFIIIGKQSVGKSRLIEALAGEQFNFVSGTLGSRRPTVLEFRNVPANSDSVWQVLDKATNKWQQHSVSRVMELMAEAHESLGKSVSKDPIYVRIQSAHCVDMQVVDLPGFREFSIDSSKEALAKEIEELDTSFMTDKRNVMICVEEAGDAANMATLGRCKQIDPNFERTVLVRNKLDKYYGDLNHENINAWLDGFGDLPAHLKMFTLTLPHWTDKDKQGNPIGPPKPFVTLRKEMSEQDLKELKAKGASEKYIQTIGFANFSSFMEHKIEEMFVDAVGPILKKLRDLRDKQQDAIDGKVQELKDTNPETLVTTIRDCGMSFAHALQHVMEGHVKSKEETRQTMDEELDEFHHDMKSLGAGSGDGGEFDFPLLPTCEIPSREDYIAYLREEAKVPAMDVAVNGGAQYRRLMIEVEVFLRFAEVTAAATKEDVIQARGVSMGQLTWRDVIVKILTNVAHLPMRRRVQYVGHRIKWFFERQKDAIMDFMRNVKGSPDEHLFSALYTKHAQLMDANDLIKQLVWTAYDSVLERQRKVYTELFNSTMSSTFSNPWVFLKKASSSIDDESSIEALELPSFEDTKARIPQEIETRGEIDAILSRWIAEVPVEPSQVDIAVERVQALVNKTHAFIRAQIADQMELFAESFFKLPMMRKIEEDMNKIELSEVDRDTYKVRREYLKDELAKVKDAMNGITECHDKLQAFALKLKARKS